MYWNSSRRRNSITFTIPFLFLPEAFEFVVRDEQSDEKKAGWLSMFKEFFPSLVGLSLCAVSSAVERFVSGEYNQTYRA
jgi:hypothetical protein